MFDLAKVIYPKSLIKDNIKIYAHTKADDKELLQEHSERCVKYFLTIIKQKNLDVLFANMLQELSQGQQEFIKSLATEMLINTIALHDMGKLNVNFQKKKMDNVIINKKYNTDNSSHSLLSALIYVDVYSDKLKPLQDKLRKPLIDMMMLNAYTILRHHGDMINLHKFIMYFDIDGALTELGSQAKLLKEAYHNSLDVTEDYAEDIHELLEMVQNNKNKEEKHCLARYIYTRLVQSVLFACDFYATTEFIDGVETTDFGDIGDIKPIYELYAQSEVYKSIRAYQQQGHTEDLASVSDINILRNELFLEAEQMLKDNQDKDIFYLEAPTGSGKSNVALNLSLQLIGQDKHKGKIFYVYPFNTLVEQNINSLSKIFNGTEILSRIAVINSLTPIKVPKGKDNKEADDKANYDLYKGALLNRQFLNYPIILTTHVSLFRYLFAIDKENLFPLHQLANSVIVLDEIQSYKNSIWSEIIVFLAAYAKMLNIKIIIMSATLPNLDKLSVSKVDSVHLLRNSERYFQHRLFKKRVEPDFSLLNNVNDKDEVFRVLQNKVQIYAKEHKKILIEFISKKNAYEFYRLLKEDRSIACAVELLSGDDNIAERERVLAKVGLASGIVLVATQMIEAGVDIDMDIGFKNQSLLDSEEQFLGRINRSCRKENCKAYFFSLDRAELIYKQDVRNHPDLTLTDKAVQQWLRDKDFAGYYDGVLQRLKDQKEQVNENNLNKFLKNKVGKLEFENIAKRMELICEDEHKSTVFLATKLVVLGQELCGRQVWSNYKRLLAATDMDYATRRVKLSEVKALMCNFMYEIRGAIQCSYSERIGANGDLYYFEDGERFFKDGKLDKEMFSNVIGEFI